MTDWKLVYGSPYGAHMFIARKNGIELLGHVCASYRDAHQNIRNMISDYERNKDAPSNR